MRDRTVGEAFAEAQPSPSILPVQAYKPFQAQADLHSKPAGELRQRMTQSQEARDWRGLVENRVSDTSWEPSGPLAGRARSTAARRQEWQASPAGWRGASVIPRMSLQQRVALAETEGFLRAKVAAKEQLCSQVIAENQQLLRQLEDSKARHRQAIERIKAEASAVVQHLLADTAVYRDTHENLLRKLELQERQATNDALRARHAERCQQEAEEKLLVLKRFVAGLQEKQNILEEEANAFTTAFRNVKSAIQTFAASLADCNFSEADGKASLEQLPEMVALGINRMQLVLSAAESSLLEKGFVKEVSAKGILQSLTAAKPATKVPATEVSRLQRERKMWENKYVKVEKELRAKEKELEQVKQENARKADALLKLRLKDHRLKVQDAEFAAAKARAHELQSELEKIRRERDELAGWKVSHPVYKGYRWDLAADGKPQPASRSLATADAALTKKSQGLETTLKLLQPREPSKASRGTPMTRSASRASLASSRRVSSVSSMIAGRPEARARHSTQRTASPMAAKTASAPILLGAVDGEPVTPVSQRASRLSLEGTGMTVLRRGTRSPSRGADTKQKPPGLPASQQAPQLERGRNLTPKRGPKAPARAVSTGEIQHHLTLTLPGSPRSVVTPVFAHGPDDKLGTKGPTAADAARETDVTGEPNRLAAFFSTAFSKAAAKEREELMQPRQEKQLAVDGRLSPLKGRSDHRASSSRLRRGGSVASTRTLVPGGRRVHIELQKATEGGSPEQDHLSSDDDQPLSPRSHIARAQAIAFMEGGAPGTGRRSGAVHTITGPRLSRMESFASERSVRTLRSPSAAAMPAVETVPSQTAVAASPPTRVLDTGGAKDAGGFEQQHTPRRLGRVGVGGAKPPHASPQASDKAGGRSATTGEPTAVASSGTTKAEERRKSQEGCGVSKEPTQPSLKAKEEVSPSQERGSVGIANAAPADVEGLLRKYLGTSAKDAPGEVRTGTARDLAAPPAEGESNTAGVQGHSTEEEDAWDESQPRRPAPEQSTHENTLPGSAVHRKTPSLPSFKAAKHCSLEGNHLVSPHEAAVASHVASTKDAKEEPVVRLGTRAGPDGGPSRLITGILKAPPKLMEKKNVADPSTERLQAPSRVNASGPRTASAAAVASAATPALEAARKSNDFSFPAEAAAPNPRRSTESSEGKLDAPPGGLQGGESGATAGGGQQRKRMSANDVAAGSWAMAAPQLNISAVKVPRHGTHEEY